MTDDIIKRPDNPTALDRPSTLTQEEAERLADTLKAGRSENTKATYAFLWKQWEAWCSTNGHSPLPAVPEVLALYLSDMVAGRRIPGKPG